MLSEFCDLRKLHKFFSGLHLTNSYLNSFVSFVEVCKLSSASLHWHHEYPHLRAFCSWHKTNKYWTRHWDMSQPFCRLWVELLLKVLRKKATSPPNLSGPIFTTWQFTLFICDLFLLCSHRKCRHKRKATIANTCQHLLTRIAVRNYIILRRGTSLYGHKS